MAENNDQNRDLVLAPGEFAYVLDTTKGLINVNVGSYKSSMASTDKTVIWDKGLRRFARCDMEKAIQRDVIAPEGFYLALYNPALEEAKAHPRTGNSSPSADLNVGHRVNIPGPAHFPLWPGQFTEVIRGHHLRSNQYLVAQVYNDDEAQKNWSRAVVKPQEGGDAPPPLLARFTPGQLMIIKGTEVAFFIPPTGVKVVADANKSFVREAVTLERLEYCILLDENGNKRYERGPAVVFPSPTEKFVTRTDENGVETRRFRAIELNEQTGLYIKVIADYKDETGDHKVGEELFVTGREQAIYFQREEHSVIRYGGHTKHYAVAVPAGEGRYVLDRHTGEIALKRGPIMLLCDPRNEVIVERVLTPKQVALWYPGNEAAIRLNSERAAKAGGLISASSAVETSLLRSAGPSVQTKASSMEFANYLEAPASRQIAGDAFQRGTSFTPPRSITLDTKYDGAVAISVWTGYAVLLVNKNGDRRVVVGPATVLLEYDETLVTLSLSTGKPKIADKPLETVYLRVANNAVSDLVRVETADLVTVDVGLSYRVTFDSDRTQVDARRWFDVEDYVGLLCDHARSLIRNTVKRKGVEEFYGNAIDLVRDAVLGLAAEGGRKGRLFVENGMRIYDVEVTSVQITNQDVSKLLSAAQVTALTGAVRIAEDERALALLKRAEAIKREAAEDRAETAEKESLARIRVLAAMANTTEQEVEARFEAVSEEERLLDHRAARVLERERALEDQRLAVATREAELEKARLIVETDEVVKRAGAIDSQLAVALTTLADQALITKAVEQLGGMASFSGISVADVLGKLFQGTPFQSVMENLAARPRLQAAREK